MILTGDFFKTTAIQIIKERTVNGIFVDFEEEMPDTGFYGNKPGQKLLEEERGEHGEFGYGYLEFFPVHNSFHQVVAIHFSPA